MTDWSGEDYARVSGLQRTMARDAIAALSFAGGDRVLDVGCGDGFITRAIAAMVPDGHVVGVDPSPRMVAAAHAVPPRGASGPWFVRADARRLPFGGDQFDVVVSFNALHWVAQQEQALAEIATVAHPGARVVIQVVCAGERPSVESVAMALTRTAAWAPSFEGFSAPFVHVDPAIYGDLAAAAGLRLASLTVTDREWDFGSREEFARWCAVGSGAWTDRLPPQDRMRFVEEQIRAYEDVVARPGVFRFMQMRAELHK
ncbi:MAG: methyltransferase domain-containing protein [Mycobacteriaceae bacterium]|nr:methyltransferase domain-containing protein [Mycobacteriaceae bacterium]